MKTEKEILSKFQQLKDTLKRCSAEHTIDEKETAAQYGATYFSWILGVDCPDYRRK